MQFSEKAMENGRRYKDIKLVATEKEKKLFSIRTKLSYNTDFFTENLLATEMKKTEILTN